jgi:hypothetical protein
VPDKGSAEGVPLAHPRPLRPVQVVELSARLLPDNKPRYLMGVGYPLDLVVCSAMGVDMFDCVYPTRTGRFGTAMHDGGLLKLKQHMFAKDTGPIDRQCPCAVCRGNYTRAYLHAMLKTNEAIAAELVTYHNLAYMSRLMRRMRGAISRGTPQYHRFVRAFLRKNLGEVQNADATAPETDPARLAAAPPLASAGGLAARAPSWVSFAMEAAGVDLGVEEGGEGLGTDEDEDREDDLAGGGNPALLPVRAPAAAEGGAPAAAAAAAAGASAGGAGAGAAAAEPDNKRQKKHAE